MESLTKNRQTNEILMQMLKAAFGEKINFGDGKNNIKINELTEGFYNIAYELIMPDRTVILKIAPPKKAVIMTYEKNLMEAEVKSLQLVKEKTKVPVPEVIFYDKTHKICDVDYFIMEKLRGESLHQARQRGLSDCIYSKILSELGTYTFEMSNIKGRKFGYFANEVATYSDFRSCFVEMVNLILTDGERISIDIGFNYDNIRKLVANASKEVEDVTVPSFVHWDLWEGNIFVENETITGLIDFERAMWTDPLMEYFFRSHCYNRDFAKGFGVDLRELYPVKANLYDLYLYALLIVETKYRNYPDSNQYNFGFREFQNTVMRLKDLGYDL